MSKLILFEAVDGRPEPTKIWTNILTDYGRDPEMGVDSGPMTEEQVLKEELILRHRIYPGILMRDGYEFDYQEEVLDQADEFDMLKSLYIEMPEAEMLLFILRWS